MSMSTDIMYELYGRQQFQEKLLELLTEITHRLIAVEQCVRDLK